MHAACANETREGEHADVEEHHGASEADERGFVLVTRPRFILRGAVQKLQGNLAADGIRGDAKDGQSVQDAQVERLLAFGIESHTHPHPPRPFLQQRVEHAAMQLDRHDSHRRKPAHHHDQYETEVHFLGQHLRCIEAREPDAAAEVKLEHIHRLINRRDELCLPRPAAAARCDGGSAVAPVATRAVTDAPHFFVHGSAEFIYNLLRRRVAHVERRLQQHDDVDHKMPRPL